MWEFPLTLWRSNRGQFRLNLDPPKCFFLFNFTRILYFFWDLVLTLFDIPKDVVFSNILVFSNIFGFPAVHWAPKRNKTVNFGCFPFILKDFSNTLLVLLKTTSGQNFSKIKQYLGEQGPKKPKKGPFHWCWINTKLHNHKCYTEGLSFRKILGHNSEVSGGHKQKTSQNKLKTFWAQFWPFLNSSVTSVAYLIHHLACPHWSKNYPRAA